MVATEELRRWARALAGELEMAAGKRSFVECLEMAESVVNDLALKHTLKIVRNMVAEGYPLSRAMERFPEVFDGVILIVVRYGEIYGELELTLRRYADKPEDMAPC